MLDCLHDRRRGSGVDVIEGGKVAKTGKLAGTGVALVGAGVLSDSVRFISRLGPADASTRRLAAGFDADGTFHMADARGTEWAARTPEQLMRALDQAARKQDVSDASVQAAEPLVLYLPDDQLWQHRTGVATLPPSVELRIVHRGKQDYALVRNQDDTGPLAVEIRAGVRAAPINASSFDEILFRAERPLPKGSMRLIRLETGASSPLPAAPTLGSKIPNVDSVDPATLTQQLRRVRGQTVVVSGRIEDGILIADAGKSGTNRIPLSRLQEAAAVSDVNLVVVGLSSAVQPGKVGWLGPSAQFKRLEHAWAQSTYGDFLASLARDDAPMILTASPITGKHVVISARSRSAKPDGIIDHELGSGRWVHVADIVARTREVEQEHDDRVVSWVPTSLQWIPLANFVLGLMAIGTAMSLFNRLWREPQQSSHTSVSWRGTIRVSRVLVFLVLFLPLAGGIAMGVVLIDPRPMGSRARKSCPVLERCPHPPYHPLAPSNAR